MRGGLNIPGASAPVHGRAGPCWERVREGSLPGAGDPFPARPTAVCLGASAPDVETSAL